MRNKIIASFQAGKKMREYKASFQVSLNDSCLPDFDEALKATKVEVLIRMQGNRPKDEGNLEETINQYNEKPVIENGIPLKAITVWDWEDLDGDPYYTQDSIKQVIADYRNQRCAGLRPKGLKKEEFEFYVWFALFQRDDYLAAEKKLTKKLADKMKVMPLQELFKLKEWQRVKKMATKDWNRYYTKVHGKKWAKNWVEVKRQNEQISQEANSKVKALEAEGKKPVALVTFRYQGESPDHERINANIQAAKAEGKEPVFFDYVSMRI